MLVLKEVYPLYAPEVGIIFKECTVYCSNDMRLFTNTASHILLLEFFLTSEKKYMNFQEAVKICSLALLNIIWGFFMTMEISELQERVSRNTEGKIWKSYT